MAELPRVPPEMFRFATTERADLHTALLDVLGAAAERLEPALTAGEARDRLRDRGWYAPVGDHDLTGALRQLAGWRLVEAVFDHAAGFATAEEYERGNLRYALTAQGEAAHAGLRQASATLATATPVSGSAHTAVLDAVADRLEELEALLADPDPGRDRRVFTCLRELECHLDGLRRDTVRLNGELRRLLRAGGADVGTFHEAEAATVAYLQEFLTGLEQRGETVARALRGVAARGVGVLHTRALAGADLPRIPGTDLATPWLAARAAAWAELRQWFDSDLVPAPESGGTGSGSAGSGGAGSGGAERGGTGSGGAGSGGGPRLRRLQEVAGEAVVTLLGLLDRVTAARRPASGAAADFRALARWFATAPAEDDAHRLWDAAFGLGPARHAHLGHADAELVPAGTPWAEAGPVAVSALLRSRGRTERMGRTGRVRDVAALRAERRARAEKEHAGLEAAWRALATTGSVRLSQLGALDHDTLGRLLDLLGRALAARPDATGLRRAVTSDGRVEVVLRAPGDGAVAVLRTSEGWFRGPDYLLDVRSPGARDHGRAEGA
ncbi:TIGR02677 family protein [Nonomuraea sp. NPDC050227]|uniref:TIGR02677 family protein n=1 Tax=Nonomuraea sp. NPDC050227 TaxID=3364360 RepID=UPI0037B7DCEE